MEMIFARGEIDAAYPLGAGCIDKLQHGGAVVLATGYHTVIYSIDFCSHNAGRRHCADNSGRHEKGLNVCVHYTQVEPWSISVCKEMPER